MVKKSSFSKTKKTQTVIVEPPQKEAPPQVMQVVEVTDEEQHVPEEKVQLPQEEPVVLEEPVHDENLKKENQQDVVSEFFAKKEEPVVTKPLEKPTSFGYPDISVHKKSPIPGILLWAVIVLSIVALIGFIIISVSRGGVSLPQLGAKPTPTPTLAPTATPTPQVDKTVLKIQVLNGSGKSGVAGTMKTLLEEKGYTVAGTGNAKNYDYTKTEIQVTAAHEAFLSVLEQDLSGSYTIGSTAATLKDTLPYNAVVIVGKE